MTDFVQLCVAGLSIGSIYAMAAIGFVLLWQTSNTINFAQGEFVVVPAFSMVLFSVVLKLPFALALVATIVVSTGLLGYLVRKLLVTRLLHDHLRLVGSLVEGRSFGRAIERIAAGL